MLRQRIITAAVLLAVLLPVLWLPATLPFAVVSLVFMGAGAWEWARLNGQGSGSALMLGAAVGSLGAASLLLGVSSSGGQSEIADPGEVAKWVAASVAWAIGGAWVLARGARLWLQVPLVLRLVLGVAVLWLAWLAMMKAKMLGLNFLLSVFCLAWMADISAYFGGRAFGRHKLAPSISPGKSWEGVWSGLLGCLLLSVVWAWADHQLGATHPSLYTRLYQRWGGMGLLLAVPGLTAMTVVGDLFKSVIKRVAGVKDSSSLLPGHGGVLDRVDALLPLFPLAWTLVVISHG